jgi:hypothetical protein
MMSVAFSDSNSSVFGAGYPVAGRKEKPKSSRVKALLTDLASVMGMLLYLVYSQFVLRSPAGIWCMKSS